MIYKKYIQMYYCKQVIVCKFKYIICYSYYKYISYNTAVIPSNSIGQHQYIQIYIINNGCNKKKDGHLLDGIMAHIHF